MKLQPRIFTLDQVNELLPEIDRLLQHVIQKKDMYDRRHDEVLLHELLTEVENSNGAGEESLKALESDYLSLEEDLNDLERELQKIIQHGCMVHDLENGCIDFLSKKNGELICYCWKVGETRVQYFHKYHSKSKDRELI